jgi:hypothetical protein
LDSRALNVTAVGRRELSARFGICLERTAALTGSRPQVRPFVAAIRQD